MSAHRTLLETAQQVADMLRNEAEGVLSASNLRLAVEPYDPKRHYEDVRNQWIGFSKDDARYQVNTVPHSISP